MSARQLLAAYEQEINTHEFSHVRDLISPDAVFWFSSGSYSGLEAIQKAFESTWQKIKEEIYSVSDVTWLTEDKNAATCIYTFKWKGLVDEKPMEGTGRGTSCFRKEDSGWKIIHEHLSRFPS